MDRRRLLEGLLCAPPALLLTARLQANVPVDGLSQEHISDIRRQWRELAPEGFNAPAPEDKVNLSREAWREALEMPRFQVLREEETEPAHSSPLNDESRPGLYVCAGCGLPLFTSAMKYESGTGWPSFFTSIPEVLETELDFIFLVPRTEYHCIRCGGHQGHVFEDGPSPTNQRWCNNGLALRFLPNSEKV